MLKKKFSLFLFSFLIVLAPVSQTVYAETETVAASSVVEAKEESEISDESAEETEVSSSASETSAEDYSSDGFVPPVSSVRDSILRVVTGYEFESDGSFDQWTDGFGFLITKECMIVSKNSVVIDENSQLYRNLIAEKGAMYQAVAGVDLNDYASVMRNVRTYVIDDTGRIEAEINPSAKGDAFAVLQLSKRINQRATAVLSENSLEEGSSIHAVCIDSASEVPHKSEFTASDVSISGVRKNGESEYVEFSGDFSTLVQGCPLIEDNQAVAGLITDGSGGRGSAVDIKTIESALDAANIEYDVVSGNTTSSKSDPADSSIETLKELYAQAEAVDRKLYTQESLDVLDKAAATANSVINDENASRNRIQKAIEPLKAALNSLVEIDHTGTYIKLGLGLALIVALIACALIIPKKISDSKKDDWELEDERAAREEKKRRKQEERNARKKTSKKQVQPSDAKKHKETQHKQVQKKANTDLGDGETGVLADGDSTGVLDDKPVTGWLVHKGDGRRVTIDKNVFLIGKTTDDIDYRITGNDTVSRRHCRVLRTGKDFYIEDLGSKNGTYIDGKKVHEGDQIRIRNGQELTISDERFVFEQEE